MLQCFWRRGLSDKKVLIYYTKKVSYKLFKEVQYSIETAYSEGIVNEIEDSEFCESERGRYYT